MSKLDKFKLRKKYRDIRKKISHAYREEAALKAAALIKEQAIFKQSMHIACYLPFQDEFDSAPIIEAIWHAKKHCYLPVLSKKDENALFFVRYDYGDSLHLNRYSILEPANITREIATEGLCLVITPLVAFDRFGHRLGTGGGYYDRSFTFLRERRHKKPHLIGLAYALQEADKLPSDPWDILVEGVQTEKAFINCF